VADDRRLWELAASDPEAFGVLFERHAASVYAFCARSTADLALAEDLTSVVFMQAWARRSRVELSSGSVLPWLLGVAVNVVRSSRRSARRYDAAVGRLPHPLPAADHADAVAERVDAERSLSDALGAIGRLSAEERDVVQLVWWAGLTYAEAAVALGTPIGTVRSRLSRARRRLQSELGSARTTSPLTSVRETS